MNSYEDEMLQRAEQPTWFKVTSELADEKLHCLECGEPIKSGETVEEIGLFLIHERCAE